MSLMVLGYGMLTSGVCVMLAGVVLLVLRWNALHRHTDRINVRDWLLLPQPGFPDLPAALRAHALPSRSNGNSAS